MLPTSLTGPGERATGTARKDAQVAVNNQNATRSTITKLPTGILDAVEVIIPIKTMTYDGLRKPGPSGEKRHRALGHHQVPTTTHLGNPCELGVEIARQPWKNMQ
ncbi:hypothetical protein IAQ61_003124 [Plenodomus lingam]|uniref:uncharacterized protein n=1 Tax=Leptosphaeria maculans TaxID=5022 RepID=UPI00331F8806|nr:hypothetical protein IAQ61_003124 [Plenodomus lingam]